jgi:hypothetical protein
MVNEEQKKAFRDGLNNVFNENIKSNEETYQKTSQWIKNVYYKCIHDTLPEEHRETLEKRLKRRKITMEEFLETKGNIDAIQELSKSKKIQNDIETAIDEVIPKKKKTEKEVKTKEVKQEVEEKVEIKEEKIETKEDLLEKRDKLEVRIHELERTHAKKFRTLNHISDEEYENNCNELKELNKQRLEINRKLDAIKVEEEKPKKEKETVTKKFEELVNKSKEKDKEINELKNEILKYKEERAYIKSKYETEFEKKLEIHSKELEEQQKEIIKEEVEKRVRKANEKAEENKQIQKKYIRNILFTENIISLDDIKFKLKELHIPTAKIEIAIDELKNEIPGIIKISNQEGILDSYSLKASATNKLDILRQTEICPKISNVMNGELKCIIRADLHIPLDSTEDEKKRIIEPYLEYSTLNNNIPIIDFGDVPDTLKDLKYEEWVAGNKEIAELIYNFYRDYAKITSSAPSVKHYQQNGNHDNHSFLVGIDPNEVMAAHSTNIIFLGAEKSSFMIGNDKIGIFHGFDNIPNISKISSPKTYKNNLNNAIEEELEKYIKDKIYSFISHYHIGMHKPLQHYSLVGREPILITAEIEDGTTKNIYSQKLKPTKKAFQADSYPVELYNSEIQYVKRSH